MSFHLEPETAAAAANYDEDKVPAYELPDPLVTLSGDPVTDSRAWREARRPEILRLFEQEVYGRSPGKSGPVPVEVIEEGQDALAGKARRKQVRLQFGADVAVDVLIYAPKSSQPAGAFLGLNFQGNHSIHTDPQIALTRSWVQSGREGVEGNRATEEARGTASSRWPVEEIVGRGYALVSAYYGDIDPDYEDVFRNGVHGLFHKGSQPAADQWGSIAAWAWGLSRILDHLEQDSWIDPKRVALIGHSRLGKTALWAGAQDERFALVISNNSGCGGAALSRRRFGETVERINTSFPHWFCDNFNRYNGREDELPLDQHMLIALIAPRPVYVASAAQDRWADPRGEFLALLASESVYKLLGTSGLGVTEMPGIDQPVGGRMGYHIRSGKHDVTRYDWEQYLRFADAHLNLSKTPMAFRTSSGETIPPIPG